MYKSKLKPNRTDHRNGFVWCQIHGIGLIGYLFISTQTKLSLLSPYISVLIDHFRSVAVSIFPSLYLIFSPAFIVCQCNLGRGPGELIKLISMIKSVKHSRPICSFFPRISFPSIFTYSWCDLTTKLKV